MEKILQQSTLLEYLHMQIVSFNELALINDFPFSFNMEMDDKKLQKKLEEDEIFSQVFSRVFKNLL